MAIKRITSYTIESISQSVKSMRIEAGMNQKELAEISGISAAAISRYEAGTRKMSAEAYMKLVQATGHQLQII